MEAAEERRGHCCSSTLIMMMRITLMGAEGGEGRTGGGGELCSVLDDQVGTINSLEGGGDFTAVFPTRMEVPCVLLSSVIWRVVRSNLAGGAQRG